MKLWFIRIKTKFFSKYQVLHAIDDITDKINNISVEDIDAGDKENPLLCAEYINDIYAYMKIMEIQYAVSSNLNFISLDVHLFVSFNIQNNFQG